MTRYFLFIFFAIVASCNMPDPAPVDPRQIFVGDYNVTEQSLTLEATSLYTCRILKDESDSLIIISNFYNAAIDVKAEVSGSKLIIPSQTVKNYIIEGFGALNQNELSLTYLVRYSTSSSNFTDDCISKCLKR